MISRRSARLIAELYEGSFSQYHQRGYGGDYYNLDQNRLYDFLFDNGYAGYFCNAAKATYQMYDTRRFKEFMMRLHTGESLVEVTPEWSWDQREKLGQRHLSDLAEDILNYWADRSLQYVSRNTPEKIADLRSALELDGYEYKDRRLLALETDVLDVQQESGVLQSLYTALDLQNRDTAFHHLQLTEEHYLGERWDDSISNSRKFLECVLQETAAKHSEKVKVIGLPESIYTKPVRVREYLEGEGLLESKEREAITSVYGLLSSTGGHPYMAQRDQARLLRHLALTFSQFVLLRLKGELQRGPLEDNGGLCS